MIPTPSKSTPSGRVQRSLDSQVLSTPLGSVYVVLESWLVLAGVYVQNRRDFLDQLNPFSITDHERLL